MTPYSSRARRGTIITSLGFPPDVGEVFVYDSSHHIIRFP